MSVTRESVLASLARKDYYIPEADVWSMLFRIAAERKRREFDPALAAVRDALRGTAEGKGEGKVQERLQQMEELLATMDGLSARFLADETASRAMRKLFFGGLLAKEEGEL